MSEFPGHPFEGKLVRTANAIDPTSRTLLVEIAVNNPTGQLFTGSYAEVHLKLPTAASAFILPVNTLLFRAEGLRVASVGDGQKVELKPITIGHDFGSEVEVVAGLDGNENVIINPPDSVVNGEMVRISQTPQQAAQVKSVNTFRRHYVLFRLCSCLALARLGLNIPSPRSLRLRLTKKFLRIGSRRNQMIRLRVASGGRSTKTRN